MVRGGGCGGVVTRLGRYGTRDIISRPGGSVPLCRSQVMVDIVNSPSVGSPLLPSLG